MNLLPHTVIGLLLIILGSLGIYFALYCENKNLDDRAALGYILGMLCLLSGILYLFIILVVT